MNIHYFQHEPFEDLAAIQEWAGKPGNKISFTRFYENFELPDINSIDMLIVLGGAMGVYEEDIHPWLKTEKKLIQEAIHKKKKILGICLGAQLLAEILGGRVYKNKEKEIGWYDIELTEEGRKNYFFNKFPSRLKVFHWHGDTFDLPPGAAHIAFSQACRNQAFTWSDHVVALQFHIEATAKSVEELAFHCSNELVEGNFIQKKEDVLNFSEHSGKMNELMFDILDKMK
jgi:GMP synthase (glutamine-hydrolysing)